MRRPSYALLLARRVRDALDCETETIEGARASAEAARRWHRRIATRAKLAAMAKRKAAAPKRQRRPRAEIDRNYFLGDVFIKTGVAATIAIIAVMLYAPGFWLGALEAHRYAYLFLLGAFVIAGLGSYLVGRHLRHEATQWDCD